MSQWVTTAELMAETAGLLGRLPPDIDIIVGMARSGLICASWLASQLHVPLYAASTEHVVPVGGGWRSTALTSGRQPHVLFVDDTSCTGRSMATVLPWVRVAFPRAQVSTTVIYATPETAATLDYVGAILPNPHYLEWNFFNSGFITSSAFDMDGILCHDVPVECDDDGERYYETLRSARPLYLPRRQPVPAIVTARLEKYREVTVEWLQRYGVAAARLIMAPWNRPKERNQPGAVVTWKAQQYANSPLTLFVESDPLQAKPIAQLSGKPVLCPAAGRLFGELPCS